MVIPRSRSMSILSSTWALISRSVRPPVAWISRSASVLFPWSMCAMIEKLRILLMSVISRWGYRGWGQGGNRDEASKRAGPVRNDRGGRTDHWSGAGEGPAPDRELLDGRRD